MSPVIMVDWFIQWNKMNKRLYGILSSKATKYRNKNTLKFLVNLLMKNSKNWKILTLTKSNKKPSKNNNKNHNKVKTS